MSNYFIILAAGESKRFNSYIPKPYIVYKGKPIIQHSIDKVKECKNIEKIILVVNKKHKKFIDKLDGVITMSKNVENELKDYSVETFSRENTIDELPELVERVDAIVHLAGENRTEDVSEFRTNNAELTQLICDAIRSVSRQIPIILASSIQAEHANPYGESKRTSELAVEKLALETENPVFIYRLPGVFGKWCKPNYNSVVATFCHNVAHDLPIHSYAYQNYRVVYKKFVCPNLRT